MRGVSDAGPTVTIFADHGPLVSEIGDELLARGAGTHTISVESGWVDSVARALMMVDTPAGMSAVRDLSDRSSAPDHVVALLPYGADASAEALCARCFERHDIVVLRATDDDVVSRVLDEVVGPFGT